MNGAIFCDSFLHYGTDQLSVKWNASTCTIGVDPFGQFGQCLIIGPTGTINKTITPVNSFTIGFRCRANFNNQTIAGTLFAAQAVLSSRLSGTLLSVQGLPDNTIGVFAGTNVLLVNPKNFTVADGVSFYIEVQVILGGTSGNVSVGTVLRINGQDLGGGSATISALLLNPTVTADVIFLSTISALGNTYVKDLYLVNGSNFLGDVSVRAIYPRSDVSHAWTPSTGSTHYNMVNEHTPDGDSTYVYTAPPPNNQRDTYYFDIIGSFVGTIAFAQLLLYARKDQEGSRVIQFALGAEVFGEAYIADQYRYYHIPFDGPGGPGDPTPWTVNGINSTDFGISLEL